ncbi:PP2C family protein-serine/threonine phosphatase [Streptomyces sp. NEAU-S7GS2]|uniref:PP2C family protein-serine/threonine phosphatase n=1 Tax=Streptomyces sp. NEAU-S7GS2 TaxID=2202000 RepID=UPI000D704BD2|nr:PP2C family protein-serine/threonine phosphatase [Streptomyces sp. NEAU-S7GS2]AWN30141.1 serine/threonine protein phosphatase [Streptomyces sp. NEAU-S7GS2]
MDRSGEWILERIGRDRGPDRGRAAGRLAEVVDSRGFEVARPPAWMRWLPVAYVVFVLLLETVTPPPWAVSFLLIALPVIAAYTLGPVAVAAATVFAVVLEGVVAGTPCCTGHNIHMLWENHHVAAYVATGLVGALGVALAAHRRRQERDLVRAHSVAEALMRTLLRPVPHRAGDLLAAGLYRSGEVGTMVGGDLYDLRATPSGERAIIGDVRGKGLQAVRTVADILGSFREAVHDEGDLPAVATRMERRLAREAEDLLDDELFVTAALIEYDAVAHRVTIINHGHIEPVLISGGEVTPLIGPPALPLGLGALADEEPVAYTHPFAHGDVLLLCTDGLIEARDHTGAFYPLLDRLRHRFGGRTAPAPGPADVIDFLNTDLPRHTRVFHDDVALLALAPDDGSEV